MKLAALIAWNLTTRVGYFTAKATLVGLVFLVAFYASTLVWAALTMNRWQ